MTPRVPLTQHRNSHQCRSDEDHVEMVWRSFLQRCSRDSIRDGLLAVPEFDPRHAAFVLLILYVLRRGEVLALVGESGAGKSTLLHLLGGLDRPSGGTIYYGHKEISGLADADRAPIQEFQ